jgi:hypothetical protein
MTMNASRIAHITATCLSEAEYRGFTLRTERMGHTNVMTDAGFYGGYPADPDPDTTAVRGLGCARIVPRTA